MQAIIADLRKTRTEVRYICVIPDQANQIEQLSTASANRSTINSQMPRRVVVKTDREKRISATNATSEEDVPLVNSKSHKRTKHGSVDSDHVVLTKFKKRIPPKSEKVASDKSVSSLRCARKCRSNVYCAAFDVDSGCRLHLLEGDEHCNNSRFCYRKL